MDRQKWSGLVDKSSERHKWLTLLTQELSHELTTVDKSGEVDKSGSYEFIDKTGEL